MNVVDAVVFTGAAVWVVVYNSPQLRRRRKQRALERQEATERALARHWLDAVAYHQGQRQGDAPGCARTGLAHVTRVYGAYPRRGTKAILTWYGGGQQDAWFELAWPRAGEWLLVAGKSGYGEHNQNPNTFYGSTIGVVPPGAFEAWRRQTAAGQLPPAPAQRD
jgi:hypothetical protein